MAPSPSPSSPSPSSPSPSPPSPSPPSASAEQEPLLGRPGDVLQRPSDSLCKNLITGTAPLAQVGGVVLFGVVWGGVFTHDLIVFSAHPLLSATAVLFAIQAVLVLQPTHTAQQKKEGTIAHAAAWAGALGCFYAALGVVEWHKHHSGLKHFKSAHAILGMSIYALLFLQAVVGVTQYFVPALYGGVDNAKAMYKYHRVFGYVVLSLVLINVVLATLTFYAGTILGIKTWATVVGSALIVLGVGPRIKKQKTQLWGRR